MTDVTPIDITTTPAWNDLLAHFATVKDLHLRDIFQADPQRGLSLIHI